MWRIWGMLPAFSTKRGKGACWSSGMGLGRVTSYSLIRTCIKPTNKLVSSFSGTPLVLGQATGNSGLTWFTTARTRGKPPPSPIYYTMCLSMAPHPNGFLSQDSQGGVPKLSRFGLLELCTIITLCSNLWLGWGLKQSCSSPQELSNGVLHSTCTHQGRVDFWLLMIGSQTANLTLGPSFCHNLCYRCPNDPCKAISTSTLQ